MEVDSEQTENVNEEKSCVIINWFTQLFKYSDEANIICVNFFKRVLYHSTCHVILRY